MITCLAPVPSEAWLTKADGVIDGFTTSPSVAGCQIALGCTGMGGIEDELILNGRFPLNSFNGKLFLI
jgi:hypothetical protein